MKRSLGIKWGECSDPLQWPVILWRTFRSSRQSTPRHNELRSISHSSLLYFAVTARCPSVCLSTATRRRYRRCTFKVTARSRLRPPPYVCIGGFNQRQGQALPPQIFLTLKFVVWANLQNDDVLRKIIEIVATWMLDFKAKKAPNSISDGAPPEGACSAPQTSSWPHSALGPPGLETTCLPKYVSLNPPMYVCLHRNCSHIRKTQLMLQNLLGRAMAFGRSYVYLSFL